MAKKRHSEKNLWGDIVHYDEHGKKIGTSTPNFFGGYTDYDEKGRKIGTSERAVFGDGFTHYDNKGHKTGSSIGNLFGDGFTEYDADGNYIGYRDKSLFDLDDPSPSVNQPVRNNQTYTPSTNKPSVQSSTNNTANKKPLTILAVIIIFIGLCIFLPKLTGYYNAYSYQNKLMKTFLNKQYDEISENDVYRMVLGSDDYGTYPGVWTEEEAFAFLSYWKMRSNYPYITVEDVEFYFLKDKPYITEEKLPKQIRDDYRTFKSILEHDYENILKDKTTYPYRDDDGTIIHNKREEMERNGKKPSSTPEPTPTPTPKSSSSQNNSSSSDPYEKDKYSDPEEFYYYHQDDFYDYEEAEEYFYDN